MLEREAVLQRIVEFLARFNEKGVVIGPETDLAADLEIDSVAAMDLVMEIEDAFDLDIPINEFADLRTVGDLVELVLRQKGDGAG